MLRLITSRSVCKLGPLCMLTHSLKNTLITNIAIFLHDFHRLFLVTFNKLVHLAWKMYIVCLYNTLSVPPTGHTMLLRRWIDVIDVDSTSQHRRVPSGRSVYFPADTRRWINVGLRWSSVVDGGPMLNQHWFSVLCLLGLHSHYKADTATQSKMHYLLYFQVNRYCLLAL